jgi:hypothetical protein
MCATGLSASVVLAQASVGRIVFVDANGNRTRDAGERGALDVAISNQDAITVTDSAGACQIRAGVAV